MHIVLTALACLASANTSHEKCQQNSQKLDESSLWQSLLRSTLQGAPPNEMRALALSLLVLGPQTRWQADGAGPVSSLEAQVSKRPHFSQTLHQRSARNLRNPLFKRRASRIFGNDENVTIDLASIMEPDKDLKLSAVDTLWLVCEGLRLNDEPEEDAGLKRLYHFLHPWGRPKLAPVKAHAGRVGGVTLEHFLANARATAIGSLSFCDSFKIVGEPRMSPAAQARGAIAQILIEVTTDIPDDEKQGLTAAKQVPRRTHFRVKLQQERYPKMKDVWLIWEFFDVGEKTHVQRSRMEGGVEEEEQGNIVSGSPVSLGGTSTQPKPTPPIPAPVPTAVPLTTASGQHVSTGSYADLLQREVPAPSPEQANDQTNEFDELEDSLMESLKEFQQLENSLVENLLGAMPGGN